VTLDRLGRYEDAIAACEQVLARNPDDPHAFAGAADAALIICDWERTARFAAELPGRVARQTSIIAPFRLLAYSADPALQRAGAELAVAQAVGVEPGLVNRGVCRDNGPIRIGYLSAQFIAHAGASLIAELIERHDRTRFAVIGLSLRPDDGSELRRRLVASFDEFHNLEAVSDRRAAELIRDLDIDIAVDLTGHSRDARLGILAQRPAPLQVSWLGHAGTMGARFIDYVIGDPVVAPLSEAANFTEKIAQLPDCYLVTDTTRAIPAGSPDRRAACPTTRSCSAASTTTTRSPPRCSSAGCGCSSGQTAACYGCCATMKSRSATCGVPRPRVASIRRGSCSRPAYRRPSISRAIGLRISFSTHCHSMPTSPPATRCGRGCRW
jgi:protein O-GlcNAc transferase